METFSRYPKTARSLPGQCAADPPGIQYQSSA